VPSSFDIHLAPKSIEQVLRLGRRLEELGYDGLFLADSHLNNIDPFQAVTAASQSLKRLRFGTAVTNMVFRDPTVLASSSVTANDLSNGRFTLGLGTGDGTVYRMGRKPTPMTAFEEGVVAIRELVNGRPVSASPGSFTLRNAGRHPLPVYLSVEGPRGLVAAGRVADGVILGSGFDLRVLQWARDAIAEGAAEAGRRLDEIPLMAAGIICIDSDGETARNRVKSRLANRAHHNFRYSLNTVPLEHRDAVLRFMDAFDVLKPIEERVPVELIPDYLVERFSIAGTAEECAARVKDLEAMGIRQFLLTPPGDHYEETVEAWAEQVIPSLT